MKRYIYLLKCPISSLVVYVGETININTRYNTHKWGGYSDSIDKKDWTKLLKSKNLRPIMEIVDEAETKREALIKESALIDSYLNKGVKLFNTNKLFNIKQFDESGKLIATFVDAKHAKEVLGFEIHVGRGLDKGYLFTKGEFDSKFFDIKNKCRKVRMKKVRQIDLFGNTVNEFDGVREACRITNIDHRSIAAVAAGSKIRKTAGGYKWEYV